VKYWRLATRASPAPVVLIGNFEAWRWMMAVGTAMNASQRSRRRRLVMRSNDRTKSTSTPKTFPGDDVLSAWRRNTPTIARALTSSRESRCPNRPAPTARPCRSTVV